MVGRRAINLPLAVVCWEGRRDLPWESLVCASLYPTKGVPLEGGRAVTVWLGPCLVMIMEDTVSPRLHLSPRSPIGAPEHPCPCGGLQHSTAVWSELHVPISSLWSWFFATFPGFSNEFEISGTLLLCFFCFPMVPFHPTYSSKLEMVFPRKGYGLNLEMLWAVSKHLRTWLHAKSLKFGDTLIMFWSEKITLVFLEPSLSCQSCKFRELCNWCCFCVIDVFKTKISPLKAVVWFHEFESTQLLILFDA